MCVPNDGLMTCLGCITASRPIHAGIGSGPPVTLPIISRLGLDPIPACIGLIVNSKAPIDAIENRSPSASIAALELAMRNSLNLSGNFYFSLKA